MKMKKVISIILVVTCAMFVGCGKQNKNSDSSTVEKTEKKALVMYEGYEDIPDFGEMYNIESNSEKEQLMASIVKNGLMKVYDIPGKQKSDIESWEDELVKNGFELVNQEDTDDGNVNTYQNDSSNETVVVTFSASTVDEGDYVVIISILKNAAASLPSADDANINEIIEKQNRIQNDGWYLLQDNWIYGLTWRNDGSGFLAKIRTDGSDYTKLLDIPLRDLFIENGYIYGTSDSGDNQGIYRVRTSGEDGSLLLGMNEPDMQIDSGYIYCSPDRYSTDQSLSEQCHLYRCNLDGTGVEEIISKRVFNWFVFGDIVLYQDDVDNESLHLYNMKTKTDQKINDQVSYCPIYDGKYIYYASTKDMPEDVSTIWRVNVDGSDNQKIADYQVNGRIAVYNDYIYFTKIDDNYRVYRINKDGSNLTQITQDVNCVSLYFSGDLLFYVSYADEEYIDKAVFCNPDGGNASEIRLSEW